MDKKTINRLGLAWVRLNRGEWDELFGEKPKDYDLDYFNVLDQAIKNLIGEANVSRCWWIYELGRTEEEWFRWYMVGREQDRREIERMERGRLAEVLNEKREQRTGDGADNSLKRTTEDGNVPVVPILFLTFGLLLGVGLGLFLFF